MNSHTALVIDFLGKNDDEDVEDDEKYQQSHDDNSVFNTTEEEDSANHYNISLRDANVIRNFSCYR